MYQISLIMISGVLTLADFDRPAIPLPPAELATPILPSIADSVVSVSVLAPQLGESPRQVAKLAAPKLSMEANVALAPPKIMAGLRAFLASTETERQEILAQEQIWYTTDRHRRPLPEGFLLGGSAVGNQMPNSKYPNLIWVVQAGQEGDAKFLEQHPEVRFIVADEESDGILGFDWLRLIDRDTCVAIVLGSTQCRWSTPESLAVTAHELIEKRRYLRQLTDAPILLGVSRVDAQERVNNQWIKALGEKEPWDGYALVGFSTFRGLREMGKQTICREAGVPEDRPAIILNWYDVATSRGMSEDLARTKQVWQANANPFVEKLRADGWKGFFMDVYTPEQLWSRMDYLQPLVEGSR